VLEMTSASGDWLRHYLPFIQKSSDEKRWVDGVLAHKKGLGF
jgi:hypothetical protein